MDKITPDDSLPLIEGKAKKIADKIFNRERITDADGLWLYEKAETSVLLLLSSYVREQKSEQKCYYNINAHLEPTNICVNQCRFCDYARSEGEPGSYMFTDEEIKRICIGLRTQKITEIHITGGVHPGKGLFEQCRMIRLIQSELPDVHIKAFTAEEISYMCQKEGLSIEQGLKELKQCGVQSLPGGGAEIFNSPVRKKLCPEKISGERWLMIHETAHHIGLTSNATMLFGHIESYADRIAHLSALRELQDKTGGFNAFIPLTYIPAKRMPPEYHKQSLVNILRNYAVSRLFIDNIPHLKAYWPMTGTETARLSLYFGVDDLDGTNYHPTTIYKTTHSLSREELEEIIHSAGREPQERNSLYSPVQRL